MAPLNPPVQKTSDPSYGNFHPINVPDNIQPKGVQQNQILPEGVKQGDRSAEFEGKAQAYGLQGEGASMAAFGDLFKDVTQFGDFLGKAGVNMVKKDIENTVYEVADRERQSYTETLERIKNGVGVKNVLDANAQMTDEDGNSTEAPAEIQGLPGTLEGLTAARDSGKISGTYYQGALLSAAKDLRAKYPGFKNEIDQAFAQVTGSTPANAYIRALTSDINRMAGSQNSSRRRTESFILQRNGYPNADQALNNFQRGLWNEDDVMRWAAPYDQEKFNLETRARRSTDSKNTREENERLAGQDVDYAIGVAVGRSADQLLGRLNMNTAEDVTKFDTLARTGGISTQQWQKIGQDIENHIVNLKVSINNDSDRLGYTQKVGGKAELNKRIDAGMQTLIALRDRVYAHDTGGIYAAAQDIKAMKNDDTKALLSDNKVGPWFRQLQVQREIGGDQWVQKFNLSMLGTDVPTQYKNYFDRWTRELQTQTQYKDGVGTKVLTLNDMADDMKAKGITNKRINNNIISQIEKIADPETPDNIKANLAVSAFDPSNRGFIQRITSQAGQNAIFQRLTSEGITKEMYRLGQKNPQLWNNYVNWTSETLANELVNREINDLAAIPNTANVRIGWDSDNHRLIPVDITPPDVRQAQIRARGGTGGSDYFTQVQSSVNRINSNLSNFKHVAQASGQDVDAFLLKAIAAANPEAVANIGGIPNDIMRQIGLSKMKQKKP